MYSKCLEHTNQKEREEKTRKYGKNKSPNASSYLELFL
jgi:hypothetical protein